MYAVDYCVSHFLSGIMCDLLWSDPQVLVRLELCTALYTIVMIVLPHILPHAVCELIIINPLHCPSSQPGRSPSKRGVGIQFGPNVTEDFISRNGLGECVCVQSEVV